MLMKRYNLIMKVQKAKVFGIIITNPSLAVRENQVEGIKSLLRKNDKQYFVFTMNKLNEPKIKNFPEIEAYIVISCPNSSLYEYSKFYKTVIVPHELRIAFEDAEWDTNIFLDSEFDLEKIKAMNSELETEGLDERLDRQLVAL